jgi:hypothetical protein
MATLTKNLTNEQKTFVDLLVKNYGPVVSRKQIIECATINTLPFPWWLLRQPFKSYRTSRGNYNLESILAADVTLTNNDNSTQPQVVASTPAVNVSL